MATGAGLLWAVLFSVLATATLQELALRSAMTTDKDLAALMRQLGQGRWWGPLFVALIVLAVGVGNAAYQSGNLTGAALGLQAALAAPTAFVIGACAAFAALLIGFDRYHWLERSLIWLVALMALVFVSLALLLLPEFLGQPNGRLLPVFNSDYLTLTLALIGTTVVPYNLFLHATAVRRRWHGGDLVFNLKDARIESAISIAVGGLITASIVVVAAVLVPAGGAGSVLDGLVMALHERFPMWGRVLVGGGLFAAGLTSAIAAPVAAGWAVCAALGWSTAPGSFAFKVVALAVLCVGAGFSLVSVRPVALILGAQATNALLLPIVAIALLVISNSKSLLGSWGNGVLANMSAVLVITLVSGLALYKLQTLL